MLDNIGPNLIMGIESIQMLQSLGETREMIVNLELTSSFGELLQFTQEWKVFTGVLTVC